MTQSYQLPDGTTTRSYTKFYQAWKELVAPIEKATGYKLQSFVPMVVMSKGGREVELTTSFIREINKHLVFIKHEKIKVKHEGKRIRRKA